MNLLTTTEENIQNPLKMPHSFTSKISLWPPWKHIIKRIHFLYSRSWNGYEDELVWAATWLYQATNHTYYLQRAEEFFEDIKWNLGVLSWDDKTVAAFAKLAELTGIN